MGEDAIKLPLLRWEIPRPKVWDYSALVVLVASILLAGFNLKAAVSQSPGESIGGSLTTAMIFGQLILASLSLFALGKTAKQGTLWGNLAAVTALLAGVSGVLLATALWAVA